MNMRIYINILFVLLIAGIVFPCSCLEPSPPEEAYEEADVVLSGTVTSKVLDASGYYFEVSLQTIDVWKGDVLGEIIVLTEANSAACGYEFQINNDYLIYAYSYSWGIYTNICTRTNLLEYANEDLDYLNQVSICDDGYTEIEGICYYQSDIEVLNVFIENSPEINLILDNNNNGYIEPLEFCSQYWSNGRLISLNCGPIIINNNYNWLEISGEVPEDIVNWNAIETLQIPYNNLSGIVPETICNLDLDFSNQDIFSLYGNDLCPPYPECIEDYMGMQSNYGTGSCELSNCYDVGVTQITAIEINGDDIVNPLEDSYGIAKLLVTMHNDGPHCSSYPGLMITADLPGTSFPEEQDESSVSWWYAMFADDTYFSEITFEISPYVPLNSSITISAESVIMNCLDESCEADPYCHDCPLTDPLSITLTIGDEFPTKLGDANIDGALSILDIVLVVSFVLSESTVWTYETNAMHIYLSDLNADYYIDVLDVVMLVDKILYP